MLLFNKNNLESKMAQLPQTWIWVCPLCDSSSEKFQKAADKKADDVFLLSLSEKNVLYSALFKPPQKREV